jgi:phosphatidylglycerophosphate synthase
MYEIDNGGPVRNVRSAALRLGPADRITLVRAVLAWAVAALVADAVVQPEHRSVIVTIAVVALVLDGVDGWVARRTGTVTPFGARFDLEVDAFLILVLSVLVARSAGVWVLAIGLARYAFVAAGRVLPWLRESAPARYWCKVVAVIQGVVLVVAVAGVLPGPVLALVLAGALALLAESFGREIAWLWSHRPVLGPSRREDIRVMAAST